MDKSSINELELIIEKYPYFINARILLLKAYKMFGDDEKYNDLLPKVASQTPNRKLLYSIIHEYEPAESEEPFADVIKHSPEIIEPDHHKEETAELINNAAQEQHDESDELLNTILEEIKSEVSKQEHNPANNRENDEDRISDENSDTPDTSLLADSKPVAGFPNESSDLIDVLPVEEIENFTISDPGTEEITVENLIADDTAEEDEETPALTNENLTKGTGTETTDTTDEISPEIYPEDPNNIGNNITNINPDETTEHTALIDPNYLTFGDTHELKEPFTSEIDETPEAPTEHVEGKEFPPLFQRKSVEEDTDSEFILNKKSLEKRSETEKHTKEISDEIENTHPVTHDADDTVLHTREDADDERSQHILTPENTESTENGIAENSEIDINNFPPVFGSKQNTLPEDTESEFILNRKSLKIKESESFQQIQGYIDDIEPEPTNLTGDDDFYSWLEHLATRQNEETGQESFVSAENTTEEKPGEELAVASTQIEELEVCDENIDNEYSREILNLNSEKLTGEEVISDEESEEVDLVPFKNTPVLKNDLEPEDETGLPPLIPDDLEDNTIVLNDFNRRVSRPESVKWDEENEEPDRTPFVNEKPLNELAIQRTRDEEEQDKENERYLPAHPNEDPSDDIKMLIDRFITNNPSISRPRSEFFNPINKAKMSEEESEDVATETLAKIYLSQELYDRAIHIYEKLLAANPDRSMYFRSRIAEINGLRNRQ